MILAAIELSPIGENPATPQQEKGDPTSLMCQLIFEYEELVDDYALAVRAGQKDGVDPVSVIIDLVEKDEISRRIVIEFKKKELDWYNVDYSQIVPMLLSA